jgi:glutaredoxin
MTKEFFKEHQVEYEEKDVAADAAAREEMFSKSGQMGVPVVTIDNEVIIGFDEQRIRTLLGI